MDENMLKGAQEEYQRQLQEYLTKPLEKSQPDFKELIEKIFKDIEK